ncbi:MAG: hypothetical protein ACE15D_05895 [Candidatus Eisenbacteria bacterium]
MTDESPQPPDAPILSSWTYDRREADTEKILAGFPGGAAGLLKAVSIAGLRYVLRDASPLAGLSPDAWAAFIATLDEWRLGCRARAKYAIPGREDHVFSLDEAFYLPKRTALPAPAAHHETIERRIISLVDANRKLRPGEKLEDLNHWQVYQRIRDHLDDTPADGLPTQGKGSVYAAVAAKIAEEFGVEMKPRTVRAIFESQDERPRRRRLAEKLEATAGQTTEEDGRKILALAEKLARSLHVPDRLRDEAISAATDAAIAAGANYDPSRGDLEKWRRVKARGAVKDVLRQDRKRRTREERL